MLDAEDLDKQYAGSCIFGLISTPDVVQDMQLFILGDVFLRHFYAVFDYKDSAVHLAVNKHAEGLATLEYHS